MSTAASFANELAQAAATTYTLPHIRLSPPVAGLDIPPDHS